LAAFSGTGARQRRKSGFISQKKTVQEIFFFLAGTGKKFFLSKLFETGAVITCITALEAYEVKIFDTGIGPVNFIRLMILVL